MPFKAVALLIREVRRVLLVFLSRVALSFGLFAFGMTVTAYLVRLVEHLCLLIGLLLAGGCANEDGSEETEGGGFVHCGGRKWSGLFPLPVGGMQVECPPRRAKLWIISLHAAQ